MKPKSPKTRSGLTLIEIMVAITVIVVGILGAMMFRYYAARDARLADIQTGAGRVALLVLEGWKGAAGAVDYDPSTDIALENELGPSDIDIEPSGEGYQVHLTAGTGAYYYIEPLEHLDSIAPNETDANKVIRELMVTVTWNPRAREGVPSDPGLSNRTVTLKDYIYLIL